MVPLVLPENQHVLVSVKENNGKSVAEIDCKIVYFDHCNGALKLSTASSDASKLFQDYNHHSVKTVSSVPKGISSIDLEWSKLPGVGFILYESQRKIDNWCMHQQPEAPAEGWTSPHQALLARLHAALGRLAAGLHNMLLLLVVIR